MSVPNWVVWIIIIIAAIIIMFVIINYIDSRTIDVDLDFILPFAKAQDANFTYTLNSECKPICLPDQFYQPDLHTGNLESGYTTTDIYRQGTEMRSEHFDLEEFLKSILNNQQYTHLSLQSIQEHVADIEDSMKAQSSTTATTDILQSSVIGVLSVIMGLFIKKKSNSK